MSQYFLPAHVHFCCRGDDFVFLDLQRDGYTLVDGEGAAALQGLLLPDSTCESPVESVNGLQELLQKGLLVTDCRKGKDVCATRIEPAIEPLIDAESAPRLRPSPLHVYRFMAACTSTAIRLRWLRLEQTVRIVERRKARHAKQRRFDLGRAREVTGIFQVLRALFPRNYLCLFDSLALLDFLARYDIYPTWVFGIKLEPWAAHCWVQERQFVFNEDVEEASGYTPIMAI